jgi:PAS domain S-box-containing protein
MADTSPILIWMTDDRGRMTFLNKSWLELTGSKRRKVPAGLWSKRVHPDDLRGLMSTFRSAAAAKQAFKVEFRIRRPDGECRWISTTGAPRYRGRVFAGYTGSAVDITLRKRSEQALRESETRYRQLAESINDVFFAVDEDLRCTYWNRASETLSGIPATDALGKSIYDLFPDLGGTELEDLLQHALASGRPLNSILRSVAPTGMLYREAFAYPSATGLTVILKDVTRREEAESALRQSETQYRTIFESANDAIIIVDPGTELILEANARACGMYGVAREELIGMSLTRLNRDVRRGEELIAETLRGGGSRNLEAVQLRNDGSLLDVVVNASVIVYGGRPAILSINRIVNERPQTGGCLQRAQELMFTSSEDAVFLVDHNVCIVVANPASERLAGYARAELRGRHMSDLILPGARETFDSWYRRILAGEDCVWESSLLCKDDEGSVAGEFHGQTVDIAGTRYVQFLVRNVSARKAAEVALRESEELMRRLVESTDDIIAMHDLEGKYVYYRAPSRFPLNSQAVLGRYPADLFEPAVAQRIMDDLATVRVSGKSVARDWHYDINGQMIWFMDLISPVLDSQGHLSGLVTVSRNVTERRFANDLLVRSEERYRAFIEQSMDGIWRVEMDQPIPTHLPEEEQIEQIFTSGRIAESNNALARYLGFRAAKDLLGAPVDTVLPRGDQRTIDILRSFIMSGYRLTDVELQHVDHDGNVRHFAGSIIGAVEGGSLVRVWGSERDISHRMRAERELRLLAQTITSTKDCVVITDMSDTILFVNDAFLQTYGYESEELIGQNFDILLRPEESGSVSQQIHEALTGGGWYGEVLQRRKDGTEFPAELWMSVVRNDESQPVALVGVGRDITERKQSEEQIRSSLREKEVLLKEIHHRVKNNLQIVSSLLSLQSEYIRDPEMLKIFSESQARVKSMALIHEKLYKSSNLAEIDFGEYVKDLAIQLFRSYGARQKGIALETELEPLSLVLDRAIPCGIIVNELVSNALKYAFPSGQRGTVYVKLYGVDDHAMELVVGDTGIGIAEGMDVATSETLGLKLVTMLSKQLEGSLTLVRNPIYKGSTSGTEFTIRFRV